MPSLSCQTIRPRSTDRHTQTHFSMCLATNLPPLHFGPPNNIFLVLSHTHKHTHTHNLSVCLLPLSPTRLQSPSPLWRLPSLPSSLPLSFIKSHCYIVKHWLDVKRRVFTIGGMGVGGMDGKKGSRNIREVDEKKRRKMYVCTHHAVSNVSAPFCLSVSFARAPVFQGCCIPKKFSNDARCCCCCIRTRPKPADPRPSAVGRFGQNSRRRTEKWRRH